MMARAFWKLVVIVSAEGYPTWDQYHCTGGHVIPDQPFACPPESTMRRMS